MEGGAVTRGVYGVPDPTQPKRRSWWKTALVVGGVGAVGYFFVWPSIRGKLEARRLLALPPGPPEPPAAPQLAEPVPPPAAQPAPTLPEPFTADPALQPVVPVPSMNPIATFAANHGFSSVADYENSALLHARQLKRDGAHVTFGPHLAHLMGRLDRG